MFKCLVCSKTRKAKLFEPKYFKIIGSKKYKVPLCCGHKMNPIK